MNELKTLEEARAFFENDVYATKTTGIKIDEIGDNYAKCSLDLGPGHKNAAGAVMGGALFTLADFCFAVAANLKGQLTVSSHSDISFLSAAKGGQALCRGALPQRRQTHRSVPRQYLRRYRRRGRRGRRDRDEALSRPLSGGTRIIWQEADCNNSGL